VDFKITPTKETSKAVQVYSDLKIVEMDSKTAMETYTSAREDEGQELEDTLNRRAKAQTDRLLEDKAGKTAKEYKKRGMGYVEPWVITTFGVVHGRFEARLSDLDHYVAKAIYATIGRCLLKARAMVN